MPVTGIPLQPRALAAKCHEVGGWRDSELVVAVAVCLSESGGYQRAWHDNTAAVTALKVGQLVRQPETLQPYTVVDPATGKLREPDGTVQAFPLTTLWVTSRDVGLFQINIPVQQIATAQEEDLYEMAANLARAKSLYDARGWQPWYGYTNGYATSTEWWHFSEAKKTWVPTGRYLHRAIRGVANYYAQSMGLSPVPFTDYFSVPDAPVAVPKP